MQIKKSTCIQLLYKDIGKTLTAHKINIKPVAVIPFYKARTKERCLHIMNRMSQKNIGTGIHMDIHKEGRQRIHLESSTLTNSSKHFMFRHKTALPMTDQYQHTDLIKYTESSIILMKN